MNKRIAQDEMAHLNRVNEECNQAIRQADLLSAERQGYLKFLAHKYSIPEGGRIEPNGEVIAPDAETKSEVGIAAKETMAPEVTA